MGTSAEASAEMLHNMAVACTLDGQRMIARGSVYANAGGIYEVYEELVDGPSRFRWVARAKIPTWRAHSRVG